MVLDGAVTRNCRARRSAISLPAGGNTEANGAGELLSKLLHFNSIRRRRTPILRVVEPAPNETCPTPTVQTPSPHYLRRRIFAYVLHSALGGKVYAHAGGSARFRECWMASDNRLLSATLQRIIGKKTRPVGLTAKVRRRTSNLKRSYRGTNRSNCGGARIRTHDVFEHPAWVKQPSAATLSTLQGW